MCHLTAEQLAQLGDDADVGIFGAGGVGAGALEQNQLGAAGFAGGAYGAVEFPEAGHAGGDDQGLAGGGGFFDQWLVVVLEAGNLESRGPELLKKIHGVLITARTETEQPSSRARSMIGTGHSQWMWAYW